MARARLLRPEFYDDDKIGSLSFGARLLYPRTWIDADMQGVFPWNARIYRVRAFPYDAAVSAEKVQSWMDEIIAAGMIEMFQVNGESYGFIKHFSEHQAFTTSEVKAGNRHPAPPLAGLPGRSNDRPENAHGRASVAPESDARLTVVRPESPSPSTSPSTSTTMTMEKTREAPSSSTTGDDIFDQPGPLQIVRARTFGDFQAMNPRIHVGRDERDSWQAILSTWGWDAVSEGVNEINKTLKIRTHRVLLSSLTAWLDEHYQLEKKDKK